MIINVKERYHKDIAAVWERGRAIDDPDFKAIYDRGAFVQDTLNEGGVLFLGIGASWDEKKLETVDSEGDIQYETARGRDQYPYYQKMIALSEATGFGDTWSNIDITLFRETSQDRLKPFFKKFPEFLQAQLDLAVKMMGDSKPKVIIASNAMVRNVIRENHYPNVKAGFVFGLDAETIDNYGTPVILEPASFKDIPIFFTSMLSGQAPLDNGSYERLIWHINMLRKGGRIR